MNQQQLKQLEDERHVRMGLTKDELVVDFASNGQKRASA